MSTTSSLHDLRPPSEFHIFDSIVNIVGRNQTNNHPEQLPEKSLPPLPEPKSRRHALFYPILIVAFLVFIGAIVGGTIGGRISARNKDHAQNNSAAPAAPEGRGPTSPASSLANPTTSGSATTPLPTVFLPVRGAGIGDYDIPSSADLMFAFDFDHSGKADHLALYRPGAGAFWIFQNQNGLFSRLHHEGDPGYGIGGYHLNSPLDRAFAFDYDHTGKLDHIALYRPTAGTFWILKNQNGTFTPVYREGEPDIPGSMGQGIGGYDLVGPDTSAFAFDFEHSGRLDYIALYRPGTGTFWILKNTGGVFSAVYREGDPGNGIGGYNLKTSADRAFAFDYGHTGMLDHLALFRPGTGIFWVLQNLNGTFQAVFHQGVPGVRVGEGVGGYSLMFTADLIFPFDYEHTGHLDHLVCYRPGTGLFWILKNQQGKFTPVYQKDTGIGGYVLGSTDRAFAFDYHSVGRLDALVLYGPGMGKVILTRGGL